MTCESVTLIDHKCEHMKSKDNHAVDKQCLGTSFTCEIHRPIEKIVSFPKHEALSYSLRYDDPPLQGDL